MYNIGFKVFGIEVATERMAVHHPSGFFSVEREGGDLTLDAGNARVFLSTHDNFVGARIAAAVWVAVLILLIAL